MELPDWVADEVPARTRGGVPLLLVLKLFRHGSAVVDPETGGRRTYWNGQPARLTGASKRALDGAIDELVALGVLRVHIPARPGTTRGYSIGFDVPAWGVVPGPRGPGRGVEPADDVGANHAPGSLAGVQEVRPLRFRKVQDVPAPASLARMCMVVVVILIFSPPGERTRSTTIHPGSCASGFCAPSAACR